ncbi:putative PLP-containing enzyme [anaerobic digester metagenome]|uniref:Putative PLP-containing enzyme n=1 Tax=anaerobic digester metagenome TaxID=1263854 RepID=A0A485M3H3_9ZZZZ
MNVLDNLNRVRRQIAATALRAGRDPAQVKLVAVTKTVPVEIIREMLTLGLDSLGENRAQELLSKYKELPPGVEWHFIGRLQTNKVKKIIDKVSLIHSLDRWSLALEISRAACEKGLTARVLVQVNASGEKTKSGLHLQEVEEFVTEASRLPGLEICGLMTIAPWTENQEDVRPVFRQVRDLSLRLQHNLKARMDCLSMGMSGDYEVALEEGANVLRIGTAIFGRRV